MMDDNSEVQELERRYPSGPSCVLDGLVALGYLSVLIVLCGGAVGIVVIVAHFLIKAW